MCQSFHFSAVYRIPMQDLRDAENNTAVPSIDVPLLKECDNVEYGGNLIMLSVREFFSVFYPVSFLTLSQKLRSCYPRAVRKIQR